MLANFEKFLVVQHVVHPEWPTNAAELTENQANHIPLYERYAYHLTFEAESSRGEAYAMDSIKNYVRGSGQLMKQKFGKAGTNLDKLDQQGNWMSRIIVNIERLHFQMADEEGIEVLFFFFSEIWQA